MYLSVCYCFSVRLDMEPIILTGFSWILIRKNLSFKSYSMKKPIANELELTVSRFRAVSGPTKHSSYMKGNWWVECCLATGATGVKLARYRRGPTRGSEALVRACAVYTRPAYSVAWCKCLHMNSAEGFAL